MTRRGSATPGLRALFERKALAELERADAMLAGVAAVRWDGDPLGHVVVVKGAPAPEDEREGRAFAGPDGEAVRKALAALGLPADRLFFTIATPAAEAPGEAASARLALQIEAVDPAIVLATDPAAAAVVASASGLDRLHAGRPTVRAGRTLLALEDLRASLTDETLKRRVWAQMKVLATDG